MPELSKIVISSASLPARSLAVYETAQGAMLDLRGVEQSQSPGVLTLADRFRLRRDIDVDLAGGDEPRIELLLAVGIRTHR